MVRKLCLFLGMGLALTGCDQTKQALGLKRERPDEFTVTRHTDLAIPPDFNTLPPPVPGSPRPQEDTPRQEAEKLVMSQRKAPSTPSSDYSDRSKGEAALLERAGVPEKEENIRATVNREARVEKKDKNFIRELVNFKKDEPKGKTIDPQEENKRLTGKSLPSSQPQAS